ncbi:hypothetical protein MS3_00000777 [Schistosoma haematobium]|uniref:Uncharacterized protein n=1 Tax=Schistosoma haematobium TaxID=6185 RepID=A0A922IHM5_SCHHA|nr:hypothetical protein MS3_00000777 [Schistosoma haematobium]KAH9579496.1 hypothetical protein MS3_00000777 [Schistosoma haematobium]
MYIYIKRIIISLSFLSNFYNWLVLLLLNVDTPTLCVCVIVQWPFCFFVFFPKIQCTFVFSSSCLSFLSSSSSSSSPSSPTTTTTTTTSLLSLTSTFSMRSKIENKKCCVLFLLLFYFLSEIR